MNERILIVDDALFQRQFERNILQENRFEVVGEASNGEEAITRYFELIPDLMILDVVMPQMNGLEVIKHVIEKDPNACIIMLSAVGDQETVINALHLGAKDYLIKPLNRKSFIQTIRRVLTLENLHGDINILLEVYNQIFDDMGNYIESALTPEILSQISYVLRSLEMEYADSLYYDEKGNRIGLKKTNSLDFDKLNQILIETVNHTKTKVEQYIPYASNIFVETFRFVYLRNKKLYRTMEQKIRFPEWLEQEVAFVDQVMSYLFKNDSSQETIS